MTLMFLKQAGQLFHRIPLFGFVCCFLRIRFKLCITSRNLQKWYFAVLDASSSRSTGGLITGYW